MATFTGSALSEIVGLGLVFPTVTVDPAGAEPSWADDRFFLNGGDDMAWGLGGEDHLDGGIGNDTLFGGDGSDTLVGGPGDDVLDDGGGGAAFVDAGEGDDYVFVNRGFGATLIGGDGIDWLDVSRWSGPFVLDLVSGVTERPGESFTGFENVISGDGPDHITGTPERNVILTHGGNDTIFSGDGWDRIFAGPGNDSVDGGADRDSILGDAGNDTLKGGAGDDYIEGGAGNDTLDGGGDLDFLKGGPGDDYLDPRQGADNIWGDAGADTFVYRTYNEGLPEVDWIRDFETGVDVVDFLSVRRFDEVWIDTGADADTTGDGVIDASDTGWSVLAGNLRFAGLDGDELVFYGLTAIGVADIV